MQKPLTELQRKFCLQIADGELGALQVLYQLSPNKTFNELLFHIWKRRITGKRLIEYWQESGATPLSFATRLNKEIKGPMFRPILRSDLI